MQVPSTNGVTLELHDLGGEGPVLLICHATGFHGRTYLPFAAELAGSFRLWAVDFRGHGASAAPTDEDFDWLGMAHDLLACIDALGGEPVFAFGHSMGGATILRAALERPGCIRAAYLYEPIVMPPDWEVPDGENRMAGPARRRREVFPSRAEAYWRYGSRTPLGVLRADCLAAYVEYGFDDDPEGVRLACRAEHEARTFEASGSMTIPMAAGVGAPVTVAGGAAADPGSMAYLVPELVAVLPEGRAIMYPQLGHFGPLQDPVTVAADLRAALLA